MKNKRITKPPNGNGSFIGYLPPTPLDGGFTTYMAIASYSYFHGEQAWKFVFLTRVE
jgi:hypothetical protein